MKTMSPMFKRAGLLALAAMALGACDFGLLVDPDPAAPGAQITISNAEGPVCDLPQGDGGPEPVDVQVVMFSSFADLSEGPDAEGITVVDTVTDDQGVFSVTVAAPTLPGEHWVVAQCGAGGQAPQAAAAQELPTVDEDGVIFDLVSVSQAPLSVSLDKSEVAPGSVVTATFNRCQDENDFDVAEAQGEAVAAEPDLEALAADYPDLVVYLDGVPVQTILGEERNPTGTVSVPVTLATAGTHEIKGVCTYQTFRWDRELLAEELGGGPVITAAAAESEVVPAAIEYPVTSEGMPFTFDEATTQAVATVSVVAPQAPAGPAVAADTATPAPAAAPAVVQPRYTG